MSEIETTMGSGGPEVATPRPSGARLVRRYRALVGLSYPTSASVIRRLLAGEDIPPAERHESHAEAGDIVQDLPAHSIPGLLAKGRIEEVPDGS